MSFETLPPPEALVLPPVRHRDKDGRNTLQQIYDDIAREVFPALDPFGVLLGALAASCGRGEWIDAAWCKTLWGKPIHDYWHLSVMSPSDELKARPVASTGTVLLAPEDKYKCIIDFCMAFCPSYLKLVNQLKEVGIFNIANQNDWSNLHFTFSIFEPYKGNIQVYGELTHENVLETFREAEEAYAAMMEPGEFQIVEMLQVMEFILMSGTVMLIYFDMMHRPRAMESKV